MTSVAKYYYRTYDRTLWKVLRHHEVETNLGCYKGAITLQRVGWNELHWTCIDTVWHQLKKSNMVMEYKLL